MPYFKEEMKSSLQGVMEEIERNIYKTVSDLKVTAWVTPEPVPFNSRTTGEKKILEIGSKWGNLWDCAWFNFKAQVPKQCKGKKVVFLIDISGEACIFDENGCPIQGLTNVSSEFEASLGRPGKRVFNISDNSTGEEEIDIWAEGGCNDLFGYYKGDGTLKEAYIAICNENTRQLYYDFEVLYDLLKNLPEDSARFHSILNALFKVKTVLIDFTEEEIVKAREILKKELDKKGGDASLNVSAIGHAHIDLAWLWPIRETIRKGSRTFSTALKMMEYYPDYVFGASQPQLYQWMKERYPALYEKIKVKVKEGRWEPQGAMWVEADTNVSGGEALVRQVLYGKRFFMDEFNKDMKILWLPDVFGYTAALPQILKKSGVDYFMTIKLSWSSINTHPHHTFFWKGIDGSTVLAHMPPEGTYNSSAAPRAFIKAEKSFLDKGVTDRCLTLYGIGDGGGGPGEEHLERLKRVKNLNGVPPVNQEWALDFFKEIEKDKENYKTWFGELYLEKHQGTYTTHAKNKKFNRLMEIKLRELETLSLLAENISGFEYPKQELDDIWKEVLLYQFHDILPGSSITRVYKESEERYEKLLDRTQKLIEEANKALCSKLQTSNMDNPLVVTNSLSWNREQWIKNDNKWFKVSVPALGYALIDGNLKNQLKPQEMLLATPQELQNDKLVIKFNEDGSIKSIFDKEFNYEVIEEGKAANKLSVYKDTGDAWDFPMTYDEIPCKYFKLINSEAYIDGPKAVVSQVYSFGESILNQDVVITLGNRRVDFITEVKWNENNKMLRTSFPVNVMSAEAACDIQFGNIKRPCHRNTSWDMAKYEICAHKWVDLSQKDYGVALMNDCKYGHKVFENILDLNLLRSSGYPDGEADRGNHKFIYSIYPHKGDYIEGNVVKEAYELNIPINVIKAEKNKGEIQDIKKSFIDLDKDNIIVETVKKAEDSDHMIIRLYECHGKGVQCSVKFNFDVEQVQLTDLMEKNEKDIEVIENSVIIKFLPFEINTIKVKIKR